MANQSVASCDLIANAINVKAAKKISHKTKNFEKEEHESNVASTNSFELKYSGMIIADAPSQM